MVAVEQILSVKEAAAYLGVKPGTLASWRHTGIGPRWGRIGPRKVAYKRSELDRFLASAFDDTTKASA